MSYATTRVAVRRNAYSGRRGVSIMKNNPTGSIVRPQRLSHGTLLCANLTQTRRFYEEFLGLEVVWHAQSAMMFRLGTGMHIVCVECGPEKLWEMHVLHDWGIDVDSQQAVDEAHENANLHKETFGI